MVSGMAPVASEDEIMAVYVDNMEAAFGRMVMCHMIADSHEELIEMADRIGVARKWIQKAGTRWEHFDIAKIKRRAAVELGAIEISRMALGRRCRAKPDAGRPGLCSEVEGG